MRLPASASTTIATIAAGTLASWLLAGCITARADGDQAGNMAPGGAGSAVSGSHPFADTEWRLVEIRSMSDTVGTIRPDDRSKYTLRLNRDGSLTMRLDCNRASGSWTARPASDRVSGHFEFGPLAMTRAYCPPPSVDQRIASQLPYVRGYLLRDGYLNLSLMADGGIFVWEPSTDAVAFQTTPDAAVEAAILAARPDYTRQTVAAMAAARPARYIHGRVDLDGDGRPEILAYLIGPYFCGSGGCSLIVLAEANGAYVTVNDFPISRLPVIVSPTRTQGWNDLIRPESGGGAPATYVRHKFDGTRYVAVERIPATAGVPEGQRILTGELAFDIGAPLIPRK